MYFKRIIGAFEQNLYISLFFYKVFYRNFIYEHNFERQREVSFLIKVLSSLYKKQEEISLLDIGFAGSWYILDILKMKNIKYTGLDINKMRISGRVFKIENVMKQLWLYILSQIDYIYADIIDYNSIKRYDIVISISTIEHILPLGYDTKKAFSPELDINAINSMKKLVKNNGFLLLTFPCGIKNFFVNKTNINLNVLINEGFSPSQHNLIVYDQDRLKKIIGNWKVVKEEYFTGAKFIQDIKENALNYEHKDSYIKSLCCILLRNTSY